MLIDFFYTLRDARIPVTIREFLDLLAALESEAGMLSIDDFYFLARTILVKDEAGLLNGSQQIRGSRQQQLNKLMTAGETANV